MLCPRRQANADGLGAPSGTMLYQRRHGRRPKTEMSGSECLGIDSRLDHFGLAIAWLLNDMQLRSTPDDCTWRHVRHAITVRDVTPCLPSAP